MKRDRPGWWHGLRPLDPVGSIKMKFAVIVLTGALLTTGVVGYTFTMLGWQLRYGLLAATLISLGVSQVLAHGMTSPLRQMTAAARQLAAGRPATPVHAGSRDEVGQLARAFSAMASELATVDGQRRQLLANVSHELRTPVAAVRAQLENMADGIRPADPAALGEVLEQVERLGALVDDLLDLARADGGAVRLDRRTVGVADLLADAVRQVAVARPGPVLDVRVEPPDLTVEADPHRFRQVVTNLVENAARFAGSRVDVEAVGVPGGGIVLEVSDDGPGIPRDRWETVFERFRGATGEIATQPSPIRSGDGGTGLGLAIARWAVVLHGGSIAVAPSPAGGCRIRVELPGSPRDLHITST